MNNINVRLSIEESQHRNAPPVIRIAMTTGFVDSAGHEIELSEDDPSLHTALVEFIRAGAQLREQQIDALGG